MTYTPQGQYERGGEQKISAPAANRTYISSPHSIIFAPSYRWGGLTSCQIHNQFKPSPSGCNPRNHHITCRLELEMET
jgi:hypothetical protein